MLLCGIVDELTKSAPDTAAVSFCQATDARINHALAVVSGLIYLLVEPAPGAWFCRARTCVSRASACGCVRCG
jgi:hypothetical protein